MTRHPVRSLATAGWLAVLVAVSLAPAVLADHATGVPERVDDQWVYDEADAIDEVVEDSLENLAGVMADLHKVEVVIVTSAISAPVEADEQAAAVAESTIAAWELGRAVVLSTVVGEAGGGGCVIGAAVHTVGPLQGATIDRARIVTETMRPGIEACDPSRAILDGTVDIVEGLAGTGLGPSDPLAIPDAGPPFPEPETDRAVYDRAGVFRPETIARAESIIDGIENRVGAEVVVYSQVVDYGIDAGTAEAHARALMDQWGVGRRGIDDGLVILFDLDPSLEHGQVQLYAGPGYRAAFLSNAERQRIFEEEMVPLLQAADLDGALLVALERVDENATPEHAQALERARQLDAAVGLIGAPIALVGLIGSAVWAWLRYGRDPVYLDDPSIHMAGPPADLTPAAATFVLAGRSSRRALTTALLDLASRGLIAFRQESHLFGLQKKVAVQMEPPIEDDQERARQARNAARKLGPAERLAFRRLNAIGTGENGYIDPTELLKFGAAVGDFDRELEEHVVAKGWFREKPSAATNRWLIRGVAALVVAAIALFGAIMLPSGGLTMIAIALGIGGVVVLVISRSMDAVSLPGAMIRAMLAAYRRTLKKTLEQARSIDQVVAEPGPGLAWLDTPDQVVVWGTALGLHEEIETVLERSLEDVRDGRVAQGATWYPVWFGASGDGGSGPGGGGGLFSSSAVPSVGGMMAALGTIGNSPSSSGGGSGGGGGFSGGGSGGGGGGAGGGF